MDGIREMGERVWLAGTIYTGTVVGGDFHSGSSYVVEVDYTGDAGFYGGAVAQRQSVRAAALLSGAAAVERLAQLVAGTNDDEAAQFEACVERLSLSAGRAAELARAGGFRVVYA